MSSSIAGSDARLAGLRVLVTRPEASQQELVDAIRSAGGEAVARPMLRILPLSDDRAIAKARATTQALDNFDLLIFISRNAVIHGCRLIDNYWPQFPIGPRLFAIGPSTAELLASQLDQPVLNSGSGMDSESLLALPAMSEVKGLKIAIFRGVGGRDVLAATLRERGAHVVYVECYLREPLTYPAADLEAVLQTAAVNTIVVNSLQTLNALLACGKDDLRVQTFSGDRGKQAQTSSLLQKIVGIPLVVPSQRIAKAARENGIQSVFLSTGADTKSILSALVQRRGDL